ncbi:putative acetyl-CoA C-acyltransferase precursor [Acaromyces ingoldii]|uniref:acetyl-CoA C-acyltransferase n=1 Tax=Acaromyces ingoldii TaxID=215250 RepID=A0A316YZ91_9BASI|nr:putative acetyl-CoA C-acyltransferase precursor [Acaromyces ingoldii]PWN93978.1 putative acetyl-CoA C-acyltransferase precursor [Acaromyces ingoldii]
MAAFRPTLAVRSGLSNILKKRPDDVVFTTALRTPIARLGKGYKHAYPEELLAFVLQRTRERLEAKGVDIKIIEDICTGTVLMELGGAKSGRLAALHAGMPIEHAYSTVNRQCASSLQSITNIANSIKSGEIACGIAAGVESMTRDWETKAIPVKMSEAMKKSPNKDARDCLMSMGLTSENVAERYGIGRQRQDEFAARSQQRAEQAQKDGRFDEEIEKIEVRWIDEGGEESTRLVDKDEGVRWGTTAEKLGKLKPAFKENGTSTAGNSSQVSDGAVALTLARRDVAEQAGMDILGRWVGTATMGVKPDVMGIGPAMATPKLLNRFGLNPSDIDLWELNEAFASQALMTIDHLGLDEDKVNVKGGAIALGHPLGASGGRLVTSLLAELRRTGKETGVATLCCGTGYGKATLVVAE